MPSFQNPVPLLHDLLATAAAEHPESEALTCGAQRTTYAELFGRATAIAHALVRSGVTRGDRVLVQMENGLDAAASFWGVLLANAVVSMIHPQTKSAKLGWLLRDCRAKALLTEAKLVSVATAAAEDAPDLGAILVAGAFDPSRHTWRDGVRSLDEAVAEARGSDVLSTGGPPRRSTIDADLACIVYTSGSTGEPKGVMLTHRNMRAAAASVGAYLGYRRDDVVLNVLPMSFDYGLYQMILSVQVGARLVLEKGFAYPAEVLARVASERVTVFPGVPTIFATIVEQRSEADVDLRTVRLVTNTAAALSLPLIERIRRLFAGARVFSMYGLTECKRCTYLPPEDLDRKPGSVGIAIPNTEIWIVDDEGNRVPPGVVGQLVVRGATVMAGYWEKPEETAKKIRPGPIPGECVLYTGDYGRLDEEGYLTFVGRMDDIIKSRGEKVAPKEIEAVLLAYPGVREAAVIGVPDPVLGQAPKAFVAFEGGRAPDAAERALRRFCQERLEGFMVPSAIELRAELPKSPNGKIDKKLLSMEATAS